MTCDLYLLDTYGRFSALQEDQSLLKCVGETELYDEYFPFTGQQFRVNMKSKFTIFVSIWNIAVFILNDLSVQCT